MLYLILFAISLLWSAQALCMEAKKCDVPTTPIVEGGNTPESLFNLATKSLGDNKMLLPLLSDSKTRGRIPNDVIVAMIQWYFLHPDSPILEVPLSKWHQKQVRVTRDYKALFFKSDYIEIFLKRKLQKIRNIMVDDNMKSLCDDVEKKINRQFLLKNNPIYRMIVLSGQMKEDANELKNLIDRFRDKITVDIKSIMLISALYGKRHILIELEQIFGRGFKRSLCLDVALALKIPLENLQFLYDCGAHASNNENMIIALNRILDSKDIVREDHVRYRISRSDKEKKLSFLRGLQRSLEDNLRLNGIDHQDEKYIENIISQDGVNVLLKNRLLYQGYKLSDNAKKKLKKKFIGGNSIFPSGKYTGGYLNYLYDRVLDVHSENGATAYNKNQVVDLRPIEYAVLQRSKETIFQKFGGPLLLLTGGVAAGTILKEKQCTII